MSRKRLELRPHDSSWARDFEIESERIRSAADDAKLEIEHVGSTSIPGIVAKPVLDVAIVCGERGLDAVVKSIQKLGYDFRGVFEPDEPDHFYAVRDIGDIRVVQAHIYESETDDLRLKIAFRDRLRQDAALAKEYNDKKVEFAVTSIDKKHYAEIKDLWVTEFVKGFL